jgi:hypothetical protein
VTERALFHAYRNATTEHFEAPCVCGETILSLTGDELSVAEAVILHNESTVHAQWARWQEAVHALQRPARRPCPCHQGAA